MGYSDGRYQARQLQRFAYITGTATASGTNALTAADLKTDAQLSAFQRKTVVTAGKLVSNIAVPANWTGLTLIGLNGTNTFATATMTGTAAQAQSLTITAANSTFTAGAIPTLVCNGTSTASGQSLGTNVVWFETQELYDKN